MSTQPYSALAEPSRLQRARYWLPGLRRYVNNTWVEITLSALGFLSGVMVTRWLGPTGRGQLAAAVLWPTTAGSIISFGLQHAFAYAVGVGWAKPRHLQAIAFKFTLLLGVPAMVVYWFMCPLIMQKQFGDQVFVPQVFSLFIPLSLYVGLLLPVYQGAGQFTTWNRGRLFRSAGWTAGVIALAALSALTVLNLLIVQLVVLVLLGVYLFSGFRELESHTTASGTAPLSRIVKYGFAVYISGLAYTLNQQLDQLLLSVWVVPSDLGQYAAAATLSGILLLVPGIAGPIVFSGVARSTNDRESQEKQVRVALFFTLALLLPAGLMLMALAPWVSVLLFGPDYVVAGEVLRILAPAAVFLGAGMTLSDIVRGAGKPIYATYGALSGALITLVGLPIALPRFGIRGAAWVSLLAYAGMMIVQAALLWKWLHQTNSATAIRTAETKSEDPGDQE